MMRGACCADSSWQGWSIKGKTPLQQAKKPKRQSSVPVLFDPPHGGQRIEKAAFSWE
jgi:hypothetical protein